MGGILAERLSRHAAGHLVLLDDFGKEEKRLPTGARVLARAPWGGYLLAEGLKDRTILTRVDSAGALLGVDTTAYRCGNRLWEHAGGGFALVSEYCSDRSDQRLILLDSALRIIREVGIPMDSPFGNWGTTIHSALLLGDSAWAYFGQGATSGAGMPMHSFLLLSTGRPQTFANRCSFCPQSYAGSAVSVPGRLFLAGQIDRSLWIAETDTTTQLLWQRTLPGPPAAPEPVWTSAGFAAATPDSGFLVTGGFGAEAWVLKFAYFDSLRPTATPYRSQYSGAPRFRTLSVDAGRTLLVIEGRGDPSAEVVVGDLGGRILTRRRYGPEEVSNGLRWVLATPPPGLYLIRMHGVKGTVTWKWPVR